MRWCFGAECGGSGRSGSPVCAPPRSLCVSARGERAPGRGLRGAGPPGAGPESLLHGGAPCSPGASQRRAEAESPRCRRAMLPWTALGLALSLRLALALSGAERGE